MVLLLAIIFDTFREGYFLFQNGRTVSAILYEN